MILRRIIAVLAALLFAVPVMAAWHPDVPASLTALSVGVLAISAARPLWGLLVVVGLLPMVMPIGALANAPFQGSETIQLLASPMLFAVAVRAIVARRHSMLWLLWPAVAMTVVVAASAITDLSVLQHTTAFGRDFLAGLWEFASGGYYVEARSYPPLHSAMIWIQALALAVVTERELATSPDWRGPVARMAIVGGTAAAAIAVYRLAEISLRTEDATAALARFLMSARISPHFPDLNAAGSYYAMMLVPAAWWATQQRDRWLLLSVPFLGLALWMTGSRSALAATVLGLALAWIIARRPPLRTIVTGGMAVLALAWLATFNTGRSAAGRQTAIEIRIELAQASLELAARQPIFGLGLDRFRPTSADILSERLTDIFPESSAGENAHNNFLQILVELGLAGLAAFTWLLVAVARPLARSFASGNVDGRAVGLVAGLFAFLLTCLSGHPLLAPQVLVPFGLMLGLAAGSMTRPDGGGQVPGVRWLGLVALVVVLGSIPARAAASTAASDLQSVVIGGQQVNDEPTVYRFDHRGRYFVAAPANGIRFELRLADGSPACRVALSIDGTLADEIRPPEGAWSGFVLSIPRDSSPDGWYVLDLTLPDSPCAVLVRRVRGLS